MTILIKNAKIATMDASNPQAEAAVIVSGFFAYVGTEDGARAYLADRNETNVEILDGNGQFLIPGFNDSHMHYLHYAKAKKSAVNLTGCTSLQEVLERMKEGFANQYDRNSGLWLTGEGWNQDYFTDEKRFPNSNDLDDILYQFLY